MRSLRRHRTDPVAAAPSVAVLAAPPLIDWTADPDPSRRIYVEPPPPAAAGRPTISVELIRGIGPHGARAVVTEALRVGEFCVFEQASCYLHRYRANPVSLWYLVSLCLIGESSERREAARAYIQDLLKSAQVN